MKRWSLRILKYAGILLLAVMMNYAVSFYCVIYNKAGATTFSFLPPSHEELNDWRLGQQKRFNLVVDENARFEFEVHTTHWLSQDRGYKGIYMNEIVKGTNIFTTWEMNISGWPMNAFKSWRMYGKYDLSQPESTWLNYLVEGLSPADLSEWLPINPFKPHMPVVPTFPGFLINTLFYFVLIYLMLHSHKIVRVAVARFTTSRNLESDSDNC